jgi:hypothetical protein
MKTITVKELGSTLPIGMWDGKTLHKDFSLRPYKSKIDRHLNAWREANEGKHIAWEVVKFLSLIIESAGDQVLRLDDKGDSTEESMAKVLDWSFGDVMYMYLFARKIVCNELTIKYGCPNDKCTVKAAEKNVDLSSVEVVVIESVKDCRFWVELIDGFRLSNTKLCKKIQLKSIPFKTLLLQGATQGFVDSLGYSQLREAIISVDGGGDNYVLTDEELDEMGKLDQLRLNRYSGKLTGGPKLQTTITCDKCKQPIVRAIDWRYEHFFDSSIPVSRLMI